MGLIKAAEILIAVAIILVFVYSIYKAIKTSRVNKANDEASRRIFLSQIDGVTINEEGLPVASKNKLPATESTILSKKSDFTVKNTVKEENPKEVDNRKEDNEDLINDENSNNYKLKDFFEC